MTLAPPTRRYILWVWAAALAQAGLTCALGVTRLYTYKTSIGDLGVFHQLLERMSHGLSPTTAIAPPYIAQNWFGFHFSPLLYILAPLHGTPETLIAAQSLLLASCAPLLYAAGRALGISARAACFFALLALINPFLFDAALFDFHEIAFAAPLMCAALWAAVSRRFGWLAASCLGLMLTKEHYGLSVAALGALWGFLHHDWRRGGALMAAGLVGTAIVMGLLMPTLGPSGIHPMLINEGTELDRYGWIHFSWQAVRQFLSLMFGGGNGLNFPGVLYLLLLLACMGYLPLRAPLFLLPAVADLLVNLLSLHSLPRLFASYHSAPLVPVLIVAAMQAWRGAAPPLKGILAAIAPLACAALLLSPMGALRYWELEEIVWHQTPADRESTLAMAKGMETCKSPMVQSSLGALLPVPPTGRPFPAGMEEADCAALHLFYPYRSVDKPLLSSPYAPFGPAKYKTTLAAMVQGSEWEIAYRRGPWLLLRRGGGLKPSERRDILSVLKRLGRDEVR